MIPVRVGEDHRVGSGEELQKRPFPALGSEPKTRVDGDTNAAEALGTEEADAPAALEAIVGFLEQNASELLGALTLVASLIVALLYKSGLLPLLRNGLSVLADTAGKTGKMTEVFTERAEAELCAIRESLAP